MASLNDLCDELILLVLSYLDIPDLLVISRTSHRFQRLTRDPLLHLHRLQEASTRLSQSLHSRPALSSLLPPSSTIYLSRTHVLARNLSRRLISIRLARNLSRRPSTSSLVQSNIIPEEFCRADKTTGQVIYGAGVSPRLLETKRKVEREQVKDGLRGWLAGKGVDEVRARGRVSADMVKVDTLVRKFTSVSTPVKLERRWGRDPSRNQCKEEPTRAKVLGLRKFWESITGGRLGVVGA